MNEILTGIKEFFAANEVAWRILLILIVAFIFWWLITALIIRAVRKIVDGVKKTHATVQTKEISLLSGFAEKRAIQRARTLGSTARSITTWTIVIFTIILIMSQFGVNITALLASAGFIGAGLAFGAQSIVKDILNGIFMVFEDQLGVGDWVKVSDNIEGTVEDVGIRITQVRSIDGTLWFVRNGEITMLGNTSQGYSQAIIDVTVSADTDLQQAQQAALDAAEMTLKDPDIRRRVTGNPEMWGVQSIYGDRTTFRFTLKTRAESHWSVERAIRKEITRVFAERGIKLANQLPLTGL